MAPVSPCNPWGPVGPVAPLGIVKFKITFSDVPLFVTCAFVPGSPVVVLPTVIVAGPCGPLGPVGPTTQHLSLCLLPSSIIRLILSLSIINSFLYYFMYILKSDNY